MEGTIKSVLADRGFGFIAPPDHPDVFFHVKDLAHELPFDEQLIGRRVRFELADTPKGTQAQDVRPAD